MKKTVAFTGSLALIALCGCTPTLKTENEVTIKPIQITLDVNVKVDKALNETIEKAPAPEAVTPATDRKSALVASMKERRPQLIEIKKKKLIGENNKGFVEIKDQNIDAKSLFLVNAENTERTELYELLAKNTNTTPEFVGSRMAARIVEKALPDTLYQDAKGEWQVKKAEEAAANGEQPKAAETK